jgi:serine/threonine protein kinase
MTDPTNLFASSSYTQGGTARWMSPELIAPQRFGLKSSRPTESSDCYALGMVIYETISGNLPFHEDTDLTVFVKVLEGERPPRGGKFREGLWRMLEQCWGSQPNNRPTIEDVLQRLEMFSNSSEPCSLEVDGEVERDGDDWDSTNGFSGVSGGTSGANSPASSDLSE